MADATRALPGNRHDEPSSPSPEPISVAILVTTLVGHFWKADPGHSPKAPKGKRDELEEAQLRLLGLWKEKQLVTRRLLAYDTTNFYTYIASNNQRNSLAQRGHNKQGRHNLRPLHSNTSGPDRLPEVDGGKNA